MDEAVDKIEDQIFDDMLNYARPLTVGHIELEKQMQIADNEYRLIFKLSPNTTKA